MPTAENSELTEKLRELSDRAAGDTGIEIAEVQLRGAGKARLLRVYIDKPGGVSHSDCEVVSERLSQLLDEHEDVLEDSYTLEVSSLGPDRKFTAARDYERVIGHKLALVLRSPLDGKARIEGKLLGVTDDRLELELHPGEKLGVALQQVSKAKLKFEP